MDETSYGFAYTCSALVAEAIEAWQEHETRHASRTHHVAHMRLGAAYGGNKS
jgi:hypothetical protein